MIIKTYKFRNLCLLFENCLSLASSFLLLLLNDLLLQILPINQSQFYRIDKFWFLPLKLLKFLQNHPPKIGYALPLLSSKNFDALCVEFFYFIFRNKTCLRIVK